MQIVRGYHHPYFSQKNLDEMMAEAFDHIHAQTQYTGLLEVLVEQINEVGYRLYGRDWERYSIDGDDNEPDTE